MLWVSVRSSLAIWPYQFIEVLRILNFTVFEFLKKYENLIEDKFLRCCFVSEHLDLSWSRPKFSVALRSRQFGSPHSSKHSIITIEDTLIEDNYHRPSMRVKYHDGGKCCFFFFKFDSSLYLQHNQKSFQGCIDRSITMFKFFDHYIRVDSLPRWNRINSGQWYFVQRLSDIK